MSDYSAEHAGALADIQAAGAAVTFSYATAGTYTEATDVTTGSTTATVAGYALGVKGNQTRYADLKLVERQKATLLFAPTTLGAMPPLTASVTWGGDVFSVKSVDDPVALNGDVILARIVIAR